MQVLNKVFFSLTGSVLISLMTFQAQAWTVDHVVGAVTIESTGKSPEPARSGQVLTQGDVVVTGEGAIALLTDEKSEIFVSSQSRFSVEETPPKREPKPGLLNLLKGKVRAKLKRSPDQAFYPYEIRANSVVAGVRGTEFFVVNEGADVHIATLEGIVTVKLRDAPDAKPIEVRAGQSFTHREGDKVLAPPRRHETKQIKKWQSETRTQRERPERAHEARERARRK